MSGATEADRLWLSRAVELSRTSPPVDTGYSVGAIIVDTDHGRSLADGYSRDTDPHVHAEESALATVRRRSLAGDVSRATIYTSLEPCSTRKSRACSCTELILASGIRRVVFALREPPLFVECHGVALLRAGGIEVIEVAELADAVRAVNSHLLDGRGTPSTNVRSR